MKNIMDILKVAKDAQANINKLQDELGAREVEAAVGGGVVIARANGKQELIGLTIKPEAVELGDLEMLQDMVLSAVNEAMRQSKALAAEEMNKIAGGLNIQDILGGLKG